MLYTRVNIFINSADCFHGLVRTNSVLHVRSTNGPSTSGDVCQHQYPHSARVPVYRPAHRGRHEDRDSRLPGARHHHPSGAVLRLLRHFRHYTGLPTVAYLHQLRQIWLRRGHAICVRLHQREAQLLRGFLQIQNPQ